MLGRKFTNLRFLSFYNKFFHCDLRKAAVVLSGCGVYDGSEIAETVSLFVSLNKNKIDFQCFAPNKNQFHVIDHTKGQEQKEQRNVLLESARIARGNIKALTDLKAKEYDAVFFPGGFGAAKNLSDFAFKGGEMSVDKDVEKVIKEFHSLRKPIGAACIAPMLIAKVLGNKGVELTLGCKTGDKWPYKGSIDAAASLGAKPIEKKVNEACLDRKNLIATSPAFMYEGSFYDIFQSLDKLVEGVITLHKSVEHHHH